LISLACGAFCFEKVWPQAHDFYKTSSTPSLWDTIDLKFLILSTNLLVVKIIQQERL